MKILIIIRRTHLKAMQSVQICIDAIAANQFLMGSLLNNSALIKNQDAIGHVDCRKTVGDENRCAILGHFVEFGVQVVLCLGIQV